MKKIHYGNRKRKNIYIIIGLVLFNFLLLLCALTEYIDNNIWPPLFLLTALFSLTFTILGLLEHYKLHRYPDLEEQALITWKKDQILQASKRKAELWNEVSAIEKEIGKSNHYL